MMGQQALLSEGRSTIEALSCCLTSDQFRPLIHGHRNDFARLGSCEHVPRFCEPLDAHVLHAGYLPILPMSAPADLAFDHLPERRIPPGEASISECCPSLCNSCVERLALDGQHVDANHLASEQNLMRLLLAPSDSDRDPSS